MMVLKAILWRVLVLEMSNYLVAARIVQGSPRMNYLGTFGASEELSLSTHYYSDLTVSGLEASGQEWFRRENFLVNLGDITG